MPAKHNVSYSQITDSKLVAEIVSNYFCGMSNVFSVAMLPALSPP